jgi:hypothetical protein
MLIIVSAQDHSSKKTTARNYSLVDVPNRYALLIQIVTIRILEKLVFLYNKSQNLVSIKPLWKLFYRYVYKNVKSNLINVCVKII